MSLKKTCRLCSEVLSDDNFEVIDEDKKYILDILLLKLNFQEIEKHIICGICSKELLEVFEFKSLCVSNNATIVHYANWQELSKLDLRDIYLKEGGHDHTVTLSEDWKVCRLCMKLAGNDFLSLQELDMEMLQTFFPEIDLNITKDPVVCKTCFDGFVVHTTFLKRCLDIEKRNSSRLLKTNTRNQETIDCHIKTEVVDIKVEDEFLIESDIKMGHFDLKCANNDQISVKTEEIEMEVDHESIQWRGVVEHGPCSAIDNCRPRSLDVHTVAHGSVLPGKPHAMDVEVITAAAIYLFTAFKYYRTVYRHKVVKKKWRKRRWWMLTIHRARTRQTMNKLISELVAEPSGEFDNFVRMSYSDFEYILQKISPIIAKKDTYCREAIPPKIRLAITLRFLATGDSYRSLHYLFKISSSLISRIIPEVCLALNQVLKDMIKIPTSPEEWLTKTKGFRFPHCLGAIDGKHITIIAPGHMGSEYFNYKGCFSIVLLALVDSDYCFQFVDIENQGKISDGGVLNQSNLWEKICDGTLNLPPSCPLPGNNTSMPYVFLGDGAFFLNTHIMKAFSGHHLLGSPERMFNQQLSHSRAVVENTFGILSSVFRIFHRPIPLDVVKTSIITHSCLLLHNFLRKSKSSRDIYTPPGSTDTYDIKNELIRRGLRANHEENLLPLQFVSSQPPLNATQVRLNFMNYIYQRRICSSSRANDV